MSMPWALADFVPLLIMAVLLLGQWVTLPKRAGDSRVMALPFVAWGGLVLGMAYGLGQVGVAVLCVVFVYGWRRKQGNVRRLHVDVAALLVPFVLMASYSPRTKWNALVVDETSLRSEPARGRLRVDQSLWRVGFPGSVLASAERHESRGGGEPIAGLRRLGVVRYNPYWVGADSSDADLQDALRRLVSDECGWAPPAEDLRRHLAAARMLTPRAFPPCTIDGWQRPNGLALGAEVLVSVYLLGVCAASFNGRGQPSPQRRRRFRTVISCVTAAASLLLWVIDEFSGIRLSWFWGWMAVPPLLGWAAGWWLVLLEFRAGGQAWRLLPLSAVFLPPLVHAACSALLRLLALDSPQASLLRTVLRPLAPDLPLLVALGVLPLVALGVLAWYRSDLASVSGRMEGLARFPPG